MGVEVDVLLAASGRDPLFSSGTLQRGISIPRCCLCFLLGRSSHVSADALASVAPLRPPSRTRKG
eukprot:8946921-Pyramimonas_sp.AAC.1